MLVYTSIPATEYIYTGDIMTDKRLDTSRVIRADHGTTLTTKSWMSASASWGPCDGAEDTMAPSNTVTAKSFVIDRSFGHARSLCAG